MVVLVGSTTRCGVRKVCSSSVPAGLNPSSGHGDPRAFDPRKRGRCPAALGRLRPADIAGLMACHGQAIGDGRSAVAVAVRVQHLRLGKQFLGRVLPRRAFFGGRAGSCCEWNERRPQNLRVADDELATGDSVGTRRWLAIAGPTSSDADAAVSAVGARSGGPSRIFGSGSDLRHRSAGSVDLFGDRGVAQAMRRTDHPTLAVGTFTLACGGGAGEVRMAVRSLTSEGPVRVRRVGERTLES